MKGVCLAHKPGTASRRKICLTGEFKRCRPDEYSILLDVSSDPSSKWQLISELQFLEAVAHKKQGESAFFHMAVVTERMKQNDVVYKTRANAFTMMGFLKFFAKEDVPRCREGVCGR